MEGYTRCPRSYTIYGGLMKYNTFIDFESIIYIEGLVQQGAICIFAFWKAFWKNCKPHCVIELFISNKP